MYQELAKYPGVLRVLASQLVARFPSGMVSLILLLHVEKLFHSYGTAGLVLAAMCCGQAAAGPVTTRWLGRWGMRPVLSLTTLACSIILSVIAVTELPLPGVLVLAVCLGFTVPPISPSARTIYPKIVPGTKLSALYSLDASAQEIIWAVGPVVAVFVSVQVSTPAALLVAAVLMLAGGAWYISSPEVGRVRIPPARRRMGAVFTRKTPALSVALNFLYLVAFAAFEAGVVSIYGHDGLEGGFIIALNAIGSMLGGIMLGHRALHAWSLPLRLGVVGLGYVLCLPSQETWWLCLVSFLGGLGAAPTFAGLSSLVSSTVKFSETAEVFGWVGTGLLIGAAIGSALAGFGIDESGAVGAFIVATVASVIAVLVAIIFRSLVPDLRGRDASPIPDTEPISYIQPPAIS